MPSSELSTIAIVEDTFTLGKKPFVPHIHKKPSQTIDGPLSVMDMLSLHSKSDYQLLKPDGWGIPSLDKASIHERENCLEIASPEAGISTSPHPTEGLDIILLPGMAFDSGLRRLGHGKGYYDYFLARYAEHMKISSTSNSQMPLLGMLPIIRFVITRLLIQYPT
jgi:5-formyltetrahydrofolate cyclo-ligase